MDKVSDFGHKKIEIEVDQDKFKDYGLNTINKLGERKNNSKDLNNTQKDNLDTMVDYNNPDDLIVSYVDQDIVGVNNTINNSELNINNKECEKELMDLTVDSDWKEVKKHIKN